MRDDVNKNKNDRYNSSLRLSQFQMGPWLDSPLFDGLPLCRNIISLLKARYLEESQCEKSRKLGAWKIVLY